MNPILIAGAGPGGLCAARALEARGLDVQLLERSPSLRTAGAGLILAVNARRVLASLGIDAELEAAGTHLRIGRVETETGVVIQDLALDRLHDQYGTSNLGIHRGSFATILADGLKTPIRFDAAVKDVAQTADGVTVTLADGSTVDGCALLGADGIHSAVRSALFGSVPLRYSGATCWRGLADVPCPYGEGVFVERWGGGPRVGVIPIGPNQTYWFATANEPAGGSDGPDPHAELEHRFASFGQTKLMEASHTLLRDDLHDLPPLARWTKGRVSLMGDAAHAMTPNLGQGANQAIEDAFALARCWSADNVPGSLQRYEAERRPRANAIVARSLQFGQVATLENPVLVALRNLVFRLTPQFVVERGTADLYRSAGS